MKQFKGVGGIIITKKTNRVMMVLRSEQETNPNTWTFPGGRVEQDETPSDALIRELKEELQLIKIEKILPLHRYQSRTRDFIYDTFIVVVNTEFVPILNWENSGYTWTHLRGLPSPLHPKTRQMISSARIVQKVNNFSTWMDKKNGRNNTLPQKGKTT